MTIRLRLLAPLALALATGLLAALPTPADATRPVTEARRPDAVFARSSYLCMGYAACRKAGMGNAGYANANDKMYWRMYSGHNCTNYAAYRMVRSGLPNVRPWSGGGNAEYWGTSVPNLTNGTPAVGAVAWWRANTGPAGSAGHVAYVERVVSSDEIVVSQDSWGGDFSWAIVTRSSGNWPSGFIHFNDVPLVNVTAPTVSGVAKVGSRLTATAGTWKPGDATVAYQWLANGQPIAGATKATLALTKARLGQRIRVRTTATELGYPTTSATSPRTGAVLPGQLQDTTAPAISGESRVDSTLTLDHGEWNPAPSGWTYRWLADGQPLGETGDQLTLTPDLVGKTISATVTATRAGYDPVTVTAGPTEPVAPGTFAITSGPAISGTPKPGQTLTLDPGSFQPETADVAVQWLRDGQPIAGADGSTYQVTTADLGGRISATVTISRSGYTTATETAPRTGRVRTDPRIRLDVTPGTQRMRLVVTVTAPGVAEVPGTVVVRFARHVEKLTLRHGSAHLRLTELPPGEHSLRVRYRVSPTVTGALKVRTVRIG